MRQTRLRNRVSSLPRSALTSGCRTCRSRSAPSPPKSLEKQQIENTSDLQLTLPNITFTKTNFTGSSFTIRGIGDLCVGVSCDQATAIHMNDAPLFNTRLFEGEFYDLAQIEVLRGPQGTLFGRNATSGVVNFRTARPDLVGLRRLG